MPHEPSARNLCDVLLGACLADPLIVGGLHEFELHRGRNGKRGLVVELDNLRVVAFHDEECRGRHPREHVTVDVRAAVA